VCDKHRVADHSVQTGQLGAVARYESEHKSERVRRKHHEIAQQGGWHGGVRCVGYEADGMTIRDSEAAETHRFADAVGDWFTRLGRGPRA
jgi:DNA invertase Pin-like site-specific DNA recombinase